jgi:hypothetical protein
MPTDGCLTPALDMAISPPVPPYKGGGTMTKKEVISFWSVLGFAGILGFLPIWAMAAELNVYAPGGVRSAVQGAATAFESQTGH